MSKIKLFAEDHAHKIAEAMASISVIRATETGVTSVSTKEFRKEPSHERRQDHPRGVAGGGVEERRRQLLARVWVFRYEHTWEVSIEDNDGQSIYVGDWQAMSQLTALVKALKGE